MTDFHQDRVSDALRTSQTLRLVSIGVLVLVLQLPIAVIGGLVSERQARRQEAVTEVSSKWGNAQTVAGPALVVPYTVRWTETPPRGPRIVRTQTRDAVFLPEQLTVRGVIDSQIRRRGIFPVVVYRLSATVEGEFARPDLADLGVQPAAVAWDRAQLALGISDVRAIQRQSAVSWNGIDVPFVPGLGTFADAAAGIHAVVGVPRQAQRMRFSLPMALNGSTSAYFVPFGKTTTVDLRSNYPSPSFQGAWLPSERRVTGKGFTAAWSVPYLGRNYPQAWKSDAGMREAVDASRFGVDLVEPLDQYHMADRSLKYASLFIALTFGAIWLIEVLAGLRVHPIPYLLLGAALCLFYLLELALSEHLGFRPAYAVASISVVGMLGAYCVTVLRRVSRALAMAAGAVLLYAYLYIVLTNEDYALLIGSVGLFVILAAVMYLTRRVDWYAGGAQPDVPASTPPSDER